MSTTLVDTNVLIALVDPRDELHERAARDLAKLAKAELRVTSAVLSESVFALPRSDQRGRLMLLLDRLPILPVIVEDEMMLRRDIFSWLERYADHEPDYSDAEICVAVGREKRQKRMRVWSYDSEFKTVWRTLDGKRLTVVGA